MFSTFLSMMICSLPRVRGFDLIFRKPAAVDTIAQDDSGFMFFTVICGTRILYRLGASFTVKISIATTDCFDFSFSISISLVSRGLYF